MLVTQDGGFGSSPDSTRLLLTSFGMSQHVNVSIRKISQTTNTSNMKFVFVARWQCFGCFPGFVFVWFFGSILWVTDDVCKRKINEDWKQTLRLTWFFVFFDNEVFHSCCCCNCCEMSLNWNFKIKKTALQLVTNRRRHSIRMTISELTCAHCGFHCRCRPDDRNSVCGSRMKGCRRWPWSWSPEEESKVQAGHVLRLKFQKNFSTLSFKWSQNFGQNWRRPLLQRPRPQLVQTLNIQRIFCFV